MEQQRRTVKRNMATGQNREENVQISSMQVIFYTNEEIFGAQCDFLNMLNLTDLGCIATNEIITTHN